MPIRGKTYAKKKTAKDYNLPFDILIEDDILIAGTIGTGRII